MWWQSKSLNQLRCGLNKIIFAKDFYHLSIELKSSELNLSSMNGWQKIMKNERNKQANGAVCVCVCEELNFTYSSLESSLPALSPLFNASTWRMSDLYARTKLQINLLKMIVKAVRCAGVYFQHPPLTCSRSASNSLSLTLCLSLSSSVSRSLCLFL